ncbi:hypothetical protein CROQUDRAFT_72568 [Cronartium quercuum f. sp. fusiforme G11]|uniref:ER membrane protein complex subunit 6 n=1 Tax=Cronartium quercuum f. sp. fusiforme G11 TaxID=708437 RepID=A0A9P6NV12_9BASI|nr:hypothetical protein CROQUDRAFT_72568 [Cronartium quercuum f. sp. fusiforme G11]
MESDLQSKSICPELLISNIKSLETIKSTTSSIAGALAGILGLKNHYGFIFYLLSSLLISTLIHLSNLIRSPSKSILFNSNKTIWSSSLIDNLFGYILWWTLFYGLVHIYD